MCLKNIHIKHVSNNRMLFVFRQITIDLKTDISKKNRIVKCQILIISPGDLAK